MYDKVASWYDWQHSLFTLNTDQKGRELVIDQTVSDGDRVLDAGAGTGTAALMAAQKTGPSGNVTLYDLSRGMLQQAKEKADRADLRDRLTFQQGDMTRLPFPDNTFDVGLSTYSMCPLYDPSTAAKELYRVVKPGGKMGIAHSTEPTHSITKKLAEWAEDLYWNVPELSLGCRAVEVLPVLQALGGTVTFKKYIGVPLWPFLVFVIEKPE